MINIIEINSVESWDKIKNSTPNKSELIIFKFSPICTISFVANKFIEKWMKEIPDTKELNIAKINVISERELSRKIAEDFEIRHESPQIIWLDEKGKVKWHGSHHRITNNNLNSHL